MLPRVLEDEVIHLREALEARLRLLFGQHFSTLVHCSQLLALPIDVLLPLRRGCVRATPGQSKRVCPAPGAFSSPLRAALAVPG